MARKMAKSRSNSGMRHDHAPMDSVSGMHQGTPGSGAVRSTMTPAQCAKMGDCAIKTK